MLGKPACLWSISRQDIRSNELMEVQQSWLGRLAQDDRLVFKRMFFYTTTPPPPPTSSLPPAHSVMRAAQYESLIPCSISASIGCSWLGDSASSAPQPSFREAGAAACWWLQLIRSLIGIGVRQAARIYGCQPLAGLNVLQIR